MTGFSWADILCTEGRSVPGVDFKAVRALVSMADVLHLIRFVASGSSGDDLRGPCPVHVSGSPESQIFSVHLGRNVYRCFKCGAQGNQLDLWAAYTKTDLHHAATDLCERLGHDIPWIRKW